jgi:hypothetical protein
MSAYMVSDKQIHVFVAYMIRNNVDYFVNHNRVVVSLKNADEVGQILLDENYRSVHHRYQDRTEGHFGKAGSYKFKPQPVVLPDAITMLKLCNNYGYQACENDDYDQSIAFKIIDAIKEQAIRKLPGYDDAPWGID